MATKYEQYSNASFTYLRTDISNSDVIVQVYNVRRFSSDLNTRVRIGNEIVRVIDVDTTNKTLTLVRGVEGTVAKPHDSGDLIISVLTQGGIDQMLTDRVLYAKTRPQYGQISDKDGLKAVAADFDWQGTQSVATATDVEGTIWFNAKRGIGSQQYSIYLTTPSTPWTFTVGYRPFFSENNTSPTSFAHSGLTIKNTANTKSVSHGVRSQSTTPGILHTMVRAWNSKNSGSAIRKRESWLQRYADMVWHRVTDDGTDTIFDVSRDGVNWELFYTESRTTWLASGPNLVGFYANPVKSSPSFGSRMDTYSVIAHMSFT